MLSLLIFIFIFIEGVKATILTELRLFFFLKEKQNSRDPDVWNKAKSLPLRVCCLPSVFLRLTVSSFFSLGSPAAYFSFVRLKITWTVKLTPFLFIFQLKRRSRLGLFFRSSLLGGVRRKLSGLCFSER